MSDEKLPVEVVEFITERIDSAVQLEILLTVGRKPGQRWTAVELDAELRINREWIAEQLAELCRRGLLSADQSAGPAPRYYSPADTKLTSDVARVAKWYSTHRVAMISLIYSKPTDKLRMFANAFRLRKDKPNG